MTDTAINLFINAHGGMIGLAAGLAAVATVAFLFWNTGGTTA